MFQLTLSQGYCGATWSLRVVVFLEDGRDKVYTCSTESQSALKDSMEVDCRGTWLFVILYVCVFHNHILLPYAYCYLRTNLKVLTKQLKLMVCVKTTKKTWKVMLKNSSETPDPQFLQRGVDFVSAYLKGFSFQDALAIVRIDGIFVESFHIADVRQRLRVTIPTIPYE